MNQLTGLYDIQKSIEEILVHSQDYPFELRADALTRQWFKAKAPFIMSFNGETVIRSEKKVVVSLSDKQKAHKFSDFISLLIDNNLMTEELKSFLELNKNGFFDNKVVCPYPSKNIRLGSKLSKSLRKFMSDSESTRWAQDAISRIIQENKVEGYLYLSVDPRDFLTLSENNSNWWSCHTLDGDYRVGNLSYMVDDTTIIAYLANDKQEHLKCLPKDMTWNSKKWRMLVHVNKDNCVYYNRQYPFTSECLLRKTEGLVNHNLMSAPFAVATESGFRKIKVGSDEEFLPANYLYCGGRAFDTRDVIDVSDGFEYCDLISSASYIPVVSLSRANESRMLKKLFIGPKKQEEEELFHELYGIKIGGKPVCPCCNRHFLDKKYSFLCEECRTNKDVDGDFYLACSTCGHRIYEDDEVFWIEDQPYCKDCFKVNDEEEI